MLLGLFLFAALFFLSAYFIYGKYQKKLYELDDNKPTPAHTFKDGFDYYPAPPVVLWGHHFSSIAGAGAVVGPIAAAAMFGWLPAYIWVLVGAVFFGGVHDMGAIVASIRHKGLSIGEVVSELIGKRGKRLFLMFTWLALVLVIAVFLDLAAQTFAAEPAVAFSGIIYTGLALLFGMLIYRYGVSLFKSSLILLPFIFLTCIYSTYSPWVQEMFTQSLGFWRIVLIIYIFAASVLPVWLLLQPRDYLASYMLYFSVFIGAVGMIFGSGDKFEVKLPAFKGWAAANGEFIWPFLFITVACGAISGFHSLVGSGTTSKQMKRESHSVLVGYGGMLLEGMVAVIAIGTIMLSGELLNNGPTVVYAQGLGLFSTLLGIDPKLGTTIGLLALSTFILTSLDTATRLSRYHLQELTDMKLGRYTATAIGIIFACVPFFWKTGSISVWQIIWPVFGASNQLVAAMALLVVGIWVSRKLKKPAKFIMFPMAFMLATTIAVLIRLLISPQSTSVAVVAFSVLILILAVLLVKESWKAIRHEQT